MAKGNFFKDTFGKVRERLDGFLYHDEGAAPAPMPSMNEEGYAPQSEGYAPQQAAPAYAYPTASYQPYQQPTYQQPYQAQQQPAYQQAAYQPQPYQAQQQPAYQQPQQEPPRQPVYQAPAQPQADAYTRNRRADRTAQRQENNVLDFPVQQVQQPDADAAQAAAIASARIINARGMGDCRSAITLLRNGDTVLIVLENISEPAEMRRLVDTLSGACYSLTATITKVSRAGVYLLAPQSMAVYADQATNQMNMAPVRAAAQPAQAGYTGQRIQRPAYQAPAYQQPTVYAAPQNGFSQRAAAPQEAPMTPFYTRQPAQNAQIPPFSAQPAGYGYTPDETAAAEQ